MVVSEHSIPILDVIRPLTKDVAESFNAEEYQRKILGVVDEKLRQLYLDRCIKDCCSISEDGIVEEEKLPSNLKDLLDDSLKRLCIRGDAKVDCYYLLSNVAKSAKFISFPNANIEHRFIAHQFSDEKSYNAFLYDLSSKLVVRNNVTDISETAEGSNTAVSSVEKIIISGIPHINEICECNGMWNSFCDRVKDSLKEREKMIAGVKGSEVKEEKPVEDDNFDDFSEDIPEEPKKEEKEEKPEDDNFDDFSEDLPEEKEEKTEEKPAEEAEDFSENEKKEEAAPEKVDEKPAKEKKEKKGKKGKKGKKEEKKDKGEVKERRRRRGAEGEKKGGALGELGPAKPKHKKKKAPAEK